MARPTSRVMTPTIGQPQTRTARGGPGARPEGREIPRPAAPAPGSPVAEPLFVLVDSAIVGHLGTPQLAGLAAASTILTTVVYLCVFLAYGTTGAVGRRM